MGDLPCVCRITGPDEPVRLLRHLGLTGRHAIAGPNWLCRFPANDCDAAAIESALAVPEGQVAVREACTAICSHAGAGITSGGLLGRREFSQPQPQWFPQATGIGAVPEHNRATHIRVTEELWPGHLAPVDVRVVVFPTSGNGESEAEGDGERRWPR